MVSDWEFARLGDVLEIKYGKDHKKLGDGDIPCFGSGGIMRYVENFIYEKESILIPRKGSLNNIYYVDQPFWTVDTLFWTKINADFAFPKFLFYQLKLVDFVSLNVGSAVPSLTVPVLNDLEIKLPPLPEQKAIAHILGSLDDKIELNRQMNETLEAMAQALFKSWFVDFDPVIDNALTAGKPIPDELAARAKLRKNIAKKDNPEIQRLFPDEFEFTEELGWIPKGWVVSEVGKVLNRLTTKVKYKKDDVSDYGKVPVYEQGSSILLGFHNNDPDIEASVKNPAFIFGDHTCVTKLSLEPFSVSANVIPLKGKDYPTIWVYYAVHNKQNFEEYRRHWMEFIIKPVIAPPLEMTKVFSKNIESFGVKQMNIQAQSSELARLRDTLLPKLMSGEIRISDAAAMVEDA